MKKNNFIDKIKLSYIETEYKPTGGHAHFHNEYSIVYVTSGVHKFETSSALHEISKGTIRIINPHEQHKTLDSEWSYINFMLSREYINFIMKNSFNSALENIKFIPTIKDEKATKLFLKLNSSIILNDTSSMEIDINAINFIEYLISNYSLNKLDRNKVCIEKKPSIEITEKVKKYIEENFKEKITLDDIAEDLQINKFLFLNEFKKRINITPYQYLLIIRANYAKELILKNISLSEVAFECGFSDQSNMIKNFKKVYNYSPSIVQKNIKNFSYPE